MQVYTAGDGGCAWCVCVGGGGVGSWQERRPLQQTCIVIGTHPTGMHSSFKHVLLMILKI